MSGAATRPVALTIAGSDSGGGAGLQADLKTWSSCGVFGASVVTCITAQNTRTVRRLDPVAEDLIQEQLDAVLDDLPVAAVKTGVLPSADVVRRIASTLRARSVSTLVVDPVLVATSGDLLAGPGVAEVLLERLGPLATLVTPNLREASTLTGRPVSTLPEMRDAASALLDRGLGAVLLKGGHLHGAAVDLLADAAGFEEFAAERVDVGPVHGTGCALSAAIPAGLARGFPLREAIGRGKRLVHAALVDSMAVGSGSRVLGFAALRL